jgi:hypothetical protein
MKLATSDRQKLIFRFSVLGVFTGLLIGFFALEAATSANNTSQKCLTTYAKQVDAIAFHAMKECLPNL